MTVTAAVPVDPTAAGNSGGSSGLSTGAKVGIGAGVGGGVGALLLLLGGLWWYRRRKQRVGDDFKWPSVFDAGSGGTAAGLYPEPTHQTGGNRFDMDDEELFDGDAATTQNGHGAGSQMMSERDPSFLSSSGYGAGMAGLGAGAAAGAAGAGAYGAAHSDRDYYSQDNHSPPASSYGGQHQQYSYDPAAQQHQFYNNNQQMPLPGGAAPAAAGGAALGRSGSIASTAANNYQVGSMPEYDDAHGGNVNDAGRPRNPRNRLSVVNALDDVGEE